MCARGLCDGPILDRAIQKTRPLVASLVDGRPAALRSQGGGKSIQDLIAMRQLFLGVTNASLEHMTTKTEHDWLDPLNWVTPKELAAILRKNVQTIYNLISAGGDLPPIYRPGGGAPRFFRPEIEAWLIKGRHVPAAVRLREEEVSRHEGTGARSLQRAVGE